VTGITHGGAVPILPASVLARILST